MYGHPPRTKGAYLKMMDLESKVFTVWVLLCVFLLYEVGGLLGIAKTGALSVKPGSVG